VTYTYDANGNRTSSSAGDSFSYNAKDQTTTAAGSTLTYLGRGQKELVTDGAATLQNNRLGVGASTTGSTTRYFTRDDKGAVLADRTSASSKYFLLDKSGSVIGRTDSSGTLDASYDYDPYGNTIGIGPTTWGFAGGYRLTSGGLYHFGNRHYDPATNIFTQRDPEQTSDTANVSTSQYSYAGDNPSTCRDPSGTTTICHPLGWLCSGGVFTRLRCCLISRCYYYGIFGYWTWWKIGPCF
jgi:RHS repeat-associated protein